MTTRSPSERSDPKVKARFPRLQLLMRRRRDEDWFSTPDDDGLLEIRTRRRI